MIQRIILRNIPRSISNDLLTDTFWLCDALGLSAGRDTDNVSSQIIFELLLHYHDLQGIPAEQLASHMGISHARINHHIRNLSLIGILYRKKKRIYLRGGSLKEAVTELRKDADRIFDELEYAATKIDEQMGIHNRENNLITKQ